MIITRRFPLVLTAVFSTNSFEMPHSSSSHLQPAQGGGQQQQKQQRPPAVLPHVPSQAALVVDMLAKMTYYFDSMVDPSRNRFYYRCLPEAGKRLHGHCPIRDLGSAWDTTTLLQFWATTAASAETEGEVVSPSFLPGGAVRERLFTTAINTIESFSHFQRFEQDDFQGPPPRRACAMLSSKVLREPPSIAHSAFWILSNNGVLRLFVLWFLVLPVFSLFFCSSPQELVCA